MRIGPAKTIAKSVFYQQLISKKNHSHLKGALMQVCNAIPNP